MDMDNKLTYYILDYEKESNVIDLFNSIDDLNNYSVLKCNSLSKVIAELSIKHYDLIIMDFTHSTSKDIKSLQEIREYYPDIYIIMIVDSSDLSTSVKPYVQNFCEKSTITSQLPLLIDSAIKYIEQLNVIKEMNQELLSSKEKLERSYLESIETLRYTVEAKDQYTRGHSDRVSEYSVLIGDKLGLPRKDLETLRLGGLLHDIGKIGISDTILTKPGKLTDEEYNEIKKHPVIGKNILSNAEIFKDILPIVLYHHERYDGHGYPYGLADKDIPFLARIISVADAFDAMTSKRSYRNELDIEYVKDEIKSKIGTQFDPVVATAFLDIINNDYRLIKEIKNKNH